MKYILIGIVICFVAVLLLVFGVSLYGVMSTVCK